MCVIIFTIVYNMNNCQKITAIVYLVYQQLNCLYIVKNIQQNKIQLPIYKSVLVTNPIGFDIAFTNVKITLNRRRDIVVSMLFQHCFNIEHRRCINVVQRGNCDVGFCFIFNVGSTLFQR